MALPKQYLTSTKNLGAILNAIKTAQAPSKFTQRFLESLEFKSTSDRLVIGVLKSLGFLADDGKPTQRYFDFLDQTQSAAVLAEGIREAYADLFAVNIKAHTSSGSALVNKLKTLTQGQVSSSVLDKMALTFTALVKHADFSSYPPKTDKTTGADEPSEEEPETDDKMHDKLKMGGLVYNIELVLPESRDVKVYDALFRSLREHLL